MIPELYALLTASNYTYHKCSVLFQPAWNFIMITSDKRQHHLKKFIEEEGNTNQYG